MDRHDLEAAVAKPGMRGLFALPDRTLAALAGAPPAQADGLAPDAWLLARLATRLRRDRPGDGPNDEARRRFELETRVASTAERVAVTARDLAVPGPEGAQRADAPGDPGEGAGVRPAGRDATRPAAGG